MTNDRPSDEKDLLLRLQQGDEKAFNTIYNAAYPSLCVFAEKITLSREDAEDITEEVFVRLWSSHPIFENITHLKAHLYRSTRHACYNQLKKEKHAAERQYHFV